MKYQVSGIVTISVSTEVEADSEEEALEIAEGAQMMSLCHYCSSKTGAGEWTICGELDGIPYDLKVG